MLCSGNATTHFAYICMQTEHAELAVKDMGSKCTCRGKVGILHASGQALQAAEEAVVCLRGHNRMMSFLVARC